MINSLKNQLGLQQCTDRRYTRIIVCIGLLFFSFISNAQGNERSDVIDSLIMRLSVLDQSPEKADVLFQISTEYSDADCARSKEYAELSLNLSEKINYGKGRLKSLNRVGELLLLCDVNVVEALTYFNEGMSLAVSINDEEMELELLHNMAYSSYALEEYPSAINYYTKVAEFAQDQQDYEALTSSYTYLSNIYLERGDTNAALDYMGTIFSMESQKNFEGTSGSNLVTISNYFELKGDYANAEKFSMEALKIFENGGSYRWLAYAYYNHGNIKLKQNDSEQAILYGIKGCQIADDRKLNKERMDNYRLLSEAYKAKGDFENTSIYLDKHYSLKDSINRAEQLSRTKQFRTEVDNAVQERENEKTLSELRARELESENDQLLIRFIILLLVLTCIFLFLLYRRLRKGNKLNKQLQAHQEQLQKLSIVAANIEQMVMIVGNDDRIEWVNNAFEKKFGFLKFEAINRTPYELLGGEFTDAEYVREINRRIFEEKQAFEVNLVQYSKDGTSYLTRLHLTPILNLRRELERYIVISHDISEQQAVAEELRELSLVASNTTNSIVIFNADMQVIWVNDSFTQMSGMSVDAVLGKGPLDIYNGPLLVEKERVDLLNKYKSMAPFSTELESTNRLTNNSYWISMNVTPVFDDEGILLKYISVATDITEIKRLEEQYSGLVEGSTDMIFEIETKGKFVFVNDVMSNLLGYSKEELLQMHFLELIVEEHRDKVYAFYDNQVRVKEPTSYVEFPAMTKEGESIWVGQRARIKMNAKVDKVVGFNVVSRDITDQKEVEEELKKTYENTSLLSEIGMQITSTHSVIEIINNVYGNINKLMDANVFGIAIPNKTHDRLVFPEVIEKGEPLENFWFDMDDDTRLGVICYKESREIIIDDFHSQIKDYVPNVDTVAPVAGEQTISTVYLPLILKGKTIGVITVQSFKANAYDEYQLNLIRSLASFVAIAMENATLYETMEDEITKRTREVREQKEELEVNYFNTSLLSEIGQLVASTLELDDIFEELYEKVGQLMAAEIFAVRIYDEETDTINFKYTIENGERCEPFVISMDESDNYNVWCIQNRKEIFLNNNKKEYFKYVNEIQVLQGEMPNSLLFYPMIVESKMIGVITIQSFKLNAYQPYHLDILKTLASYIGTVIDNAQLYSTLETKVQERTEELAQKNNDITASINYAKRLQKGILPAKSFMQQLLPESFVYFKPKDIVSGDFYWVDRTQSKILLAVVDCTGHGVPGAMMSIIGRNLLDQAVNEKGITLPSQILNFLQVGLSLAFGQTGERKADLFDGMDLSLCSIDLKNNILEFAGANNSLYLIQDDELIVLKGDKVGISAEYEISNSYTNLEIEIKKGDVIYLTSDGYPDQFGGPRYKKFTYGRMQEIFKSIYTLDMNTQYDIIKKEITEWKGDKDQTDDMCIMGVRI